MDSTIRAHERWGWVSIRWRMPHPAKGATMSLIPITGTKPATLGVAEKIVLGRQSDPRPIPMRLPARRYTWVHGSPRLCCPHIP
eukprot:scaffold12300_cov132-Isochrysis_galbana.AAC.15